MPTVALPPKVRAVIYWVMFVSGVVLSCLTAAYGVLQDVSRPDWLDVAYAVYGVLGAAFGVTAASHTVVNRDRVNSV